MKIDMRPAAVTRRLKTAAELRRLCLALADSSAGREILRKFPDDPQVRRTAESLPVRPSGAMLSETPSDNTNSPGSNTH